MTYKEHKKFFSTKKYYSIINKLEQEHKIDYNTQLVLRNLTLEDIIAVKLELSARSVRRISLWGAHLVISKAHSERRCS